MSCGSAGIVHQLYTSHIKGVICQALVLYGYRVSITIDINKIDNVEKHSLFSILCGLFVFLYGTLVAIPYKVCDVFMPTCSLDFFHL